MSERFGGISTGLSGARAYDEASTEFAHSGSVEPAAKDASEALDDPALTAELKKTEAAEKKRSRGEDPAI